jgi:phosphate transport system protein
MPREIFHRELDRLVEEVVELGREVESCLDTMVEALERQDAETARQQIGIDSRYKERGAEIDEECMILQARQAPVARNLFREGLDVFENREIDRARDLEAADDKVDLLYSEAMNLVVNPSKERLGSPEWRVRAALMVHYLERIADHGVDIGGRTVFLVTGERMESAMRQYRERRIESDED